MDGRASVVADEVARSGLTLVPAKPRVLYLVTETGEQQGERILYASSGIAALLGLAAEIPIVGSTLEQLLSLAAPESLKPVREASTQPTGSASRILLELADGRRSQIEFAALDAEHQIICIETGPAVGESAADLFHPAHLDALTGIGNRAFFHYKLDAALDRIATSPGSHAAVLFLDLDRFKIVNDTLGHAVGDQLLRLVSERLRSALRPSDSLARMGGDEFAVLLEPSDQGEAAGKLAARIIDLVERTYLIDGQVVNVGASIGIALAPQDGASGERLLRSADLALYFSKAAGRGVFHFFIPAMREKAEQRRALELDLRKALMLRQFELHYRPQIDVRTQRITGVEALLHWRRAQHGLLAPSEFLGVAEEIGMALPLSEWVMKTACREAKRWPEPTTIAVHLSPLQFETGKVLEIVQCALAAAQLPGGRLEIEVTEDILQRNGASLIKTLLGLRELGVRVAMASFGNGLASLSQLVQFPFDQIKIDRALTGLRSGEDARSRAIVRAVSALGQSLGISTLAEGVETAEHLEYVQSQGCRSVQGCYYSSAVPASALPALFAAAPSLSQPPTSAITLPEVLA